MFVGFTNCKTCQRVIVPAFVPPFAFFMHIALTPYIKSNQQQWCLRPLLVVVFIVHVTNDAAVVLGRWLLLLLKGNVRLRTFLRIIRICIRIIFAATCCTRTSTIRCTSTCSGTTAATNARIGRGPSSLGLFIL
jgi:hypothetical protein